MEPINPTTATATTTTTTTTGCGYCLGGTIIPLLQNASIQLFQNDENDWRIVNEMKAYKKQDSKFDVDTSSGHCW